jgi:hypothetical protein
MDSEFKQFLDTLKILGIKFSINWSPDRIVWQSIIKEAGYEITATACTAVELGAFSTFSAMDQFAGKKIKDMVLQDYLC